MSSITDRIKIFNGDRTPDLLRLKYEAISTNVFRFYRGTCHIFYEDLSKESSLLTSPAGWICGDLHLENFGSYRGDNKLVYFDINDFDEGILAPVHWELLRIVTSIFVAFQSLNMEKRRAEKLARLFIQNYASTLGNGKAIYTERQIATGIICDFLEQASQKKYKEVIDRYTRGQAEERKLITDNIKYLKIEKPLRQTLLAFMQDWLQKEESGLANYKAMDCIFRVAGTGSLGLKRYIFLIRYQKENGAKYMLLDMKQARGSSLASYTNIIQPSWNSESQRITEIQKRMQNCTPALLHTVEFNKEDFIIKQLQPQSDSMSFTLFCEHYRDMYDVISNMAVLTASAQLRSSGRQGSAIADELIAFGNDESWHESIISYASSYTDKVAGYFEEFVADH